MLFLKKDIVKHIFYRFVFQDFHVERFTGKELKKNKIFLAKKKG
jgi:hypothetical protein